MKIERIPATAEAVTAHDVIRALHKDIPVDVPLFLHNASLGHSRATVIIPSEDAREPDLVAGIADIIVFENAEIRVYRKDEFYRIFREIPE